jgi:hypothetical protein
MYVIFINITTHLIICRSGYCADVRNSSRSWCDCRCAAFPPLSGGGLQFGARVHVLLLNLHTQVILTASHDTFAAAKISIKFTFKKIYGKYGACKE